MFVCDCGWWFGVIVDYLISKMPHFLLSMADFGYADALHHLPPNGSSYSILDLNGRLLGTHADVDYARGSVNISIRYMLPSEANLSAVGASPPVPALDPGALFWGGRPLRDFKESLQKG